MYIIGQKADTEIIKQSEEERKSAPTKADVERVLQILSDFHINGIVIPEFSTVADLERWQRKTILDSF